MTWFFMHINHKQSTKKTDAHLHYVKGCCQCRCIVIVKVHRVFPSSRNNVASSQKVQFHRAHSGDSGEVVTPFMQVITYMTRDFATLGPSGLRPPFTVLFIRSLNFSCDSSAQGRCQTLYIIFRFSRVLCF